MRWVVAFTIAMFFCGCGALQNTPKYELSAGWYQLKNEREKRERVYVNPGADSIIIYALLPNKKSLDTAQPLLLMAARSTNPKPTTYLSQNSFDIDFLTIPFKFRPGLHSFPKQFTTSLNGAVYLGFRRDVYRLQYGGSPLGTYHLRNRHFGFSGGLFTGIGATAMNPWVTSNAIDIEYDGVAWSKGLAGIVAIDRFTVGLTLGWDYLLDKNRKVWLYQNKPWVGLAFGLNLN